MHIDFIKRDLVAFQNHQIETAHQAFLAVRCGHGAIPAPAKAVCNLPCLMRRVVHVRRVVEKLLEVSTQRFLSVQPIRYLWIAIDSVSRIEGEPARHIFLAPFGKPARVEIFNVDTHSISPHSSPSTNFRRSSVNISGGNTSGPAMMAAACAPSVGSALERS